VDVIIPAKLVSEKVSLYFDTDSEGMIWSVGGEPLQGLTGGNGGDRHIDFILTEYAVYEGQKISIFVEVACNGRGGVANQPNLIFTLSTCELRVENNSGTQLFKYFDLLMQIARDTPAEYQINSDALYTANKIINTFRVDDFKSVQEGLILARNFFDLRKGSTNPSRHELFIIGNCHLDTGFLTWLWPFDETKRKAARSFSTQIGIMKKYPKYIFTASQAQHFDWIKSLYPSLFKEMQIFNKRSQFVPVGGTWVEMDTNMPSGEALCRQFFLDGSSIIAHLPPSDNIMSQGTVVDLMSPNNNKDKLFSNKSVIIFGNGDGGGGPLTPMLDRLELLENVEGLPARLTYATPNIYFETLEKTSKPFIEWKGELYFEAHRGTYTTAGFVKRGNRKGEILLRLAEYLSSLAAIKKVTSYPKKELDRLWKLLLLCQFHDVLPGSSIGLVFDDAKIIYDDILSSSASIITNVLRDLTPRGKYKKNAVQVYNTTSWPLDALIEVNKIDLKNFHQETEHGKFLIQVGSIPAHSVSTFVLAEIDNPIIPVQLVQSQSGFVVENKHIVVKIDSNGRLVSLIHKLTGRESIAPDQLANQFKLFEDIPAEFDAWDIEPYQLEKGWDVENLGIVFVKASGPLKVVLTVTHKISAVSWINQDIIVNSVDAWVDFDNTIEWHENRLMLRVEFPVNINSDLATYETQYGFVQRPTHYNTSWDLAKFEVCGHRFADLSEFGFGVSLLNDCKYGYAIKGNIMRLSLLRAPK
ncbi:Alpha-mannosidase 2C1, partial [Physocladia obscura]